MLTGHPIIISAAVITPVISHIPLQPATQLLQHVCVVTGMRAPVSSLHWEAAAIPRSELQQNVTMDDTNPAFSALTSLQTPVCRLWIGHAQYGHSKFQGVGHSHLSLL